MPNKYSHAFVLSRYETRGFITLPHRLLDPSPTPFSPSEFDLYDSKYSDATDAPSLNAVPALSDSSTTSTASSLDEPTTQPLHSESSSIITEIYAPKSPALDPISSTIVSIKENPRETLSDPPPDKQILPQSPPPHPPPKSRFSTFHDLSHFITRHSSVSTSAKTPSRKRQHLPRSKTAKSRKPSISLPSHSRPNSYYQLPPTSIPASPEQRRHTFYKRLEPAFDTDSLRSLSLEELDDEWSQSSDMNVLPWECSQYSNTQVGNPPVYIPRGFPPTQSETHYTPAAQAKPSYPENHSAPAQTTPTYPEPNIVAFNENIFSAPPAHPYPKPNQSRSHSPDRPSSPRTIILSTSTPSSPTSSYSPTTQSTYSQQSRPTSPSLLLYHHESPSPTTSISISLSSADASHSLFRQESTESFDSAAPPPIRITPRYASEAGGGLKRGHSCGKGRRSGSGMEKVRVRTRGRGRGF
ncbi:MAG: hypothetical protein Q9178_002395 [Gyalolechia marmorata]